MGRDDKTVLYYKGEHGNKPYELELMLCIYLLQSLYDLSDMKIMNEVIDSRAFSDFCGVDSPNQVPGGDTIGKFPNILVENGLQEKLFNQVYPQQKRMDIKAWNNSEFQSYCCTIFYKKTKIKSVTRTPIPLRKEISGILDTDTRLISELTKTADLHII